MIEHTGLAPSLTHRRLRFCLTLLASLACLVLCLSARPAQAQEPDDAYLPIYTQVQEAEALEAGGHPAQALTNYQRAAVALKAFQRKYPTWNAKVVNQRLNRLSEKITALSQKPLTPVAPRTNAPAAAATNSAKESSGSAEGKVTVLQPGEEPRKVLRLHPKAGDKQTLEMTVTMAMENKMGPVETPVVKLPPMKLTMEVSVKEVSAQGEITYDLTVTDASVGEDSSGVPGVAEMLKASMASAKGISGTGTATDRGITKAIKLANGADAHSGAELDQMTGMLSGGGMTLPEEPVGPGAKWELRKVEKMQGVSVNETETYELVALEGDRLTLKLTKTQSAANQKIQSPAAAKVATKMEVTKLVGTGTSEMTCDLGQLMPVEASGKHHLEKLITVTAPQKHSATQIMDIEAHLQAK